MHRKKYFGSLYTSSFKTSDKKVTLNLFDIYSFYVKLPPFSKKTIIFLPTISSFWKKLMLMVKCDINKNLRKTVHGLNNFVFLKEFDLRPGHLILKNVVFLPNVDSSRQ